MTDTLSPASLIPAGTIIPYLGGAQSSPPSGWLFCNGDYVSYDTYGDLFAAISYTYGQSGLLFRLPTHSAVLRGSSSIGLGNLSQNHSHSFSFSTSGNLVDESGHSHTLNAPSCVSADDSHTHSASSAQNSNASSTNANFDAVSGSANYLSAPSHTHSVGQSYASAGGMHNHAGSVGNVGGGNAHSHGHGQNGSGSSNTDSLLPPVIYIWHIIKT